jgi:hypothetical protein
LPEGWEKAAREQGAFRRARYLPDPAALLRVVLFHAVNDGGLRDTVQQARASAIAQMSQVALLKRLRTAGPWLAWIAEELCRGFREQPRLPEGSRLRAIDATTVQGPASKGTDWRIHYTLDLLSLHCDWHELTDGHSGESLMRVPIQKGDVFLADRAYMSPRGVGRVVEAGGDVLVRLRWNHSWMLDVKGRPFFALKHARRLKVGQIGQWPVTVVCEDAEPVEGRVVALPLPRPLAAKAERRASKRANRRGRKVDARTLEAAHFVMLFTTLPAERLDPAAVLELYRCRWQIELTFKRLKQLLKLGRLPHKEISAARSWILAKLVVALVLEVLYRNARSFSPWGYEIQPTTSALSN